MKPVLDPRRDLKGATPEKLAQTLLRPVKSSSRASLRAESVVSNKVSVKKAASNQSGHRASHLSKGSE